MSGPPPLDYPTSVHHQNLKLVRHFDPASNLRMLFQNFLHSFMRVSLCLCLPLATSTVKAMPTRSLFKNQKELVRYQCSHCVGDYIQCSFKLSSQPITLYMPTTALNAENLVNQGGNLKKVYQEPFGKRICTTIRSIVTMSNVGDTGCECKIGNYRRLFTILPELDEKSGDYAVVGKQYFKSSASGQTSRWMTRWY